MLVLTRKIGESICVGGDIEIVITEITKTAVRVGVKAPRETTVYRKEVYERILLENQEASHTRIDNTKLIDLSRLLNKRFKKG